MSKDSTIPNRFFQKKMSDVEVYDISKEPRAFRIELLRELGFEVDPDGIHILRSGKRVLDKYLSEPVCIDNMSILPGPAGIAIIIVGDSLFSHILYVDEMEEGEPAKITKEDREAIRKHIEAKRK